MSRGEKSFRSYLLRLIFRKRFNDANQSERNRTFRGMYDLEIDKEAKKITQLSYTCDSLSNARKNIADIIFR